MPLQYIFILGTIAVFGLFAFGMSVSIKKHNKKMAGMKKKKGFR